MDYLDIDWDSELEIGKNCVNHTKEIWFSTERCALSLINTCYSENSQ